MSSAPFNYHNNPTTLINSMIGEAYPVVKKVSDNIFYITSIYENLEILSSLSTNLEAIAYFRDNEANIIALTNSLEELEFVHTNITALLSIHSNMASILNLNTNYTNILNDFTTFETYVDESIQAITDLKDELDLITTIYDEYDFVVGTANAEYGYVDSLDTFPVNYTDGKVIVFRNGLGLTKTVDYTATNGTTIVLTSNALVGQSIKVIVFNVVDLVDIHPFLGATGVPSGAMGSVGQFYIDETNGNLYRKTDVGTWTLKLSLKGSAGDPATVVINSVTSGAVPSITNIGTPTNAIWNVVFAKGDAGTAATITINSITTGAAGTNVEIENIGTATNHIWNVTIPRGADGTGNVNTVNGISPSLGNVLLTPDDLDDTLTTNKFATEAQLDKVDLLTVTGPANIDDLKEAVAALDSATILKGEWDASAGTFPGAGAAQAGWSYIVSVGGTVDGVAFSIGDRLIAILDDASATTFATNWFKADYTDQVLSVAGLVGAISGAALKTALAIALADITDASANGRSLVSAADYAAMRVLLGVVGKQSFYVSAGGMTPNTTGGPAVGSLETTTNKVMVPTLDFDASAVESAQFNIRMPKQWNEGTITATVIWCHPATTTNFNAAFDISAVAIGDDDTLDAAFGTAVQVNDIGGTTNDLYTTPESTAITIAGTPAAEDVVFFRVRRVATDGTNDTLAVDAKIVGVTIYVTTDAGTDA